MSLFRAGQRNAESAASSSHIPGLFPSTEEEQSQSNMQSAFQSASNKLKVLFIRPIAYWVLTFLLVIGRLLRFLYFVEGNSERPSGATTISTAIINDPIRRAEQFVEELEENLLPQQQFSLYHSDSNEAHLPPFFQGSYTQALYMATQRAKFLFIYLTNPQNEGSRSMFENIVTSKKFISIFSENNQVIIWGGDLANPEAYQLANSLNITKFPMLGLLCLTRTTSMTPQGPTKTTPRISLILKIQGGLNPQEDADMLINNKFTKRMMKYEPELALIRGELRDKYMADAVRRKQDMDYQQALMKDRQKKEEKARKKLVDKFLKLKQPYFRNLVDAQPDGSNTARIAIKFENGRRQTVNFPKTSPISDIFLFVELSQRGMLESAPEGAISDQDERNVADVPMKYDFKLTSSAPPRPSLNDLDVSSPIYSLEFLYPNGLLMVEKC